MKNKQKRPSRKGPAFDYFDLSNDVFLTGAIDRFCQGDS